MEPLRDDRFWMERAFDAARSGWGRALPNPCVGAVVVSDGREISSGHSLPAAEGGTHAEAAALAAAGERARGAVLYVTLEPCSHFGRTPPCADAVVRAGISRVVVGVRDPNPLVDGKGIRILREGGVEVSFEGLDGRLEEAYAGFFHRILTGRPLVELKLALTADGFAARADGSPLAVTGPEARVWTHGRRALCDAVAVTSRTARNDRPLLNVRDCGWPVPPAPARVVLGRAVDLSASDPLFAPDGAAVLLFGREFPGGIPASAERIPLSRPTPAEAFSALVSELGSRGMHRVWVEAGPAFCAALLDSALVDRFFLLRSPENAGSGLPAEGVLNWVRNAEIARLGSLGRDSLAEYRLPPNGTLRQKSD